MLTTLYIMLVFLFIMRVLRKPTSPPLPLREGPPLISVFSNSLYDPFGSPCRGQKPQGRRGNRSSLSLWTISFYGWRTIRGLRQQQSCGFLCGMNRRDTLFRMFATCSMLKGCLLDACCLLELLFEGTADKMDGALRNLLILSSYSP